MLKLQHIGIATDNLPQWQRLLALLSLPKTHSEAVKDQGVVTHFHPIATDQASLELLEVTDPEGTVAKFLAKRGPGIHHLAFEVGKGDLELLCAKLQAAGIKLLYETPRLGAHSKLINFIHPSSAGGVLIELTCESP